MGQDSARYFNIIISRLISRPHQSRVYEVRKDINKSGWEKYELWH